MSYLLTEIALEMLGYKFYDTNGAYHLTNFQLAGQQIDLHPDEKTLQTLLLGEDEPEDVSEEPIEATNQSASNQEESNNQLPNIIINNRRVPLKRLLESECLLIKSELKQKIFALLTSGPQSKYAVPIETRIKDYMMGEPNRLMSELNVMRDFRIMVEERMQKIDKKLFEKYMKSIDSTELIASSTPTTAVNNSK